MSPDSNAGLLKNKGGSITAAGLGGYCNSDSACSVDFPSRGNEPDASLSSDDSSIHALRPSKQHGSVYATAYETTEPSSSDPSLRSYRLVHVDDAPETPSRMASFASRPPLLPHNGDSDSRSSPKPAIYSLSRSTVRSASSPLEGKTSAAEITRTPVGKPSVKDLKKRFDQNIDVTANARIQVPLAAAPHPVTRPTVTATNGTAIHPNLGAGSSKHAPTQAAHQSAQRSKFVAQGALFASSQSFASRIGKPRGSIAGTTPASKSMTQLPHKVPLKQVSSSPPTASGSGGLLFGEITPDQYRDLAIAGFGIQQGTRRRRTSASSGDNLHAHHRSLSDPDAEPPSPSSWYRQGDASHHDPQHSIDSHPRRRTRSRSDAEASFAVAAGIVRRPLPRSSTSTSPASVSRLPVSVRKLSGATNTSSPSSTRSSSPSAVRCSLASTRVKGANSVVASRIAAPGIRAKTPTQTATGRKPPPQALFTPDKNTRRPAFVAATQPTLSPPLRSSRPRLPVSSATTASSRMKATVRQGSRDRSAHDFGTGHDASARRRKISLGPIDFEQRREHIRLAYSKSIRESEANEERRNAAGRRRRGTEAGAHVRASGDPTQATSADSAPAAKLDTVGNDEQTATEHDQRLPTASSGGLVADQATEPPSRNALDQGSRHSVPSLTLRTAIGSKMAPDGQSSAGVDSPTLGVPGGFPVTSPPGSIDKQPMSALSATSETTEFDAEPQTNPPIQAQSPLEVPITVIKPPSPERPISAHRRVGYQYSFLDGSPAQHQLSMNHEGPRGVARTATTDEPADDGVKEVYWDAPPKLEPIDCEPKAQATVITIVSPAEDADGNAPRPPMPFPRLDMHDESDCTSDADNVRPDTRGSTQDDDATTDACTEETDDRERIEYHQSDLRLDGLSSHRTSTCTSSDPDAMDDTHDLLHDQSVGSTNPSTLAVPRSVQNARLSDQSAWTDFSVDSTDQSDTAKSSVMHSRHESPSFGHVTIFESITPARESVYSYRDAHYRSDAPRVDGAKTSASHTHHSHLPDVDTTSSLDMPGLLSGAGGSISFLPSPDHDPPPVPAAAPDSTFNSRGSSVFYDQSYHGSTMVNSEREGDDYASPLATPQSMDMAAEASIDHYFSSRPTVESNVKPLDSEADSKERHRLVQRRNVIKELIDTEAVFVRDMNIVEEIYKGTAEACPKLDTKTVKLIFRNSDEIIQFHTCFLKELKEAVSSIYIPSSSRGSAQRQSALTEQGNRGNRDAQDTKDRATSVGPVFQRNMESMKLAHEGFLRNSDHAAKRLIQIQQDPTVQVWLNECNEVAKDLTAAWDLDSLLIKPMQRITKYPNLIITLLQHTPHDHPDRDALSAAKESLENAIIEINKTKKNFELVGQIVGRKRKESDVKAGFARAFGKRVDKLQASNRPAEDADYAKLNEKFGDDYLRLQVVLRDVEFYTRQVSAYVHEFLQYLSSVELVMRLQPGNYPELESKWVQFNISVRDLEKVALDEHLTQVRKHVIEPFELVIKAYGNPSLAMKKRQKRRLDFERFEQLKRAGKSVDPKLRELVEQYDALNDTLKKELPMLSALTEKVGNICLGNFVNIQANWYGIWKEKMKTVIVDCPELPDLEEVVATFQRDFPYARDQLSGIGILNPSSRGRVSQSTTSVDEPTVRMRGRGLSVNGDAAPTLPQPDFGALRGGSFSVAPSPTAPAAGGSAVTSPHQYYYRDYYYGINGPPSTSTRSPEMVSSSRMAERAGPVTTRPSTGRSYESGSGQRQSSESTGQQRRDSNTTHNSAYPHEGRRYSNIFHSALPLPDGPEDSRRSSRASSRDRSQTSDGYNILWLAASLFEFNISTTKHEAGYPYLTYQAGEASPES
ncbi:hypothetical protein HIM_02524 [Hirsutella minnesotensis 3608]|nr:hypothetical protein HIM_02524 [Hirsutella minnesotensis 3608]